VTFVYLAAIEILMVRNKRQALTQTPSPTPPSPPIKNLIMDTTIAEMNAKLDLLCGSLQKISDIETTVKSMDASVKSLALENQALRADLAARDVKIQSLTDQLNRLDQSSRSNSLRILGLPVTTQSTSAKIVETVYKEILLPTLQAAKAWWWWLDFLFPFSYHILQLYTLLSSLHSYMGFLT
jgi:regulator of replication initiation timing